MKCFVHHGGSIGSMPGNAERTGRRSAARYGAIAATCTKRSPAMIATIENSRTQRVPSTSSLRMFWIVLKPISGRNSPKAISAVTPASRSARTTSKRGAGTAGATASSGMSHLLDVGAAEKALRQEDHHDREDRERGHVLVSERYVFAPQRLDDADQQPA